MRAAKKKILVIAGSAVALIVVAAGAAALVFNVNAYKPEIEAAVSDAAGLDVRINGRMGLSFFPFGISASDIHIADKGGEVLSLERLKVGAEIIPLLRKHLKVTGCEAAKPAVTVVEYAEGKYNFERGEPTKGWLGTAFSVHRLKVFGGSLVYLDKRTGIKTELKEIDLAATDLTVADIPGVILKKPLIHREHELQGAAKKRPHDRQHHEFHERGEGSIPFRTGYREHFRRKG